MSDHLDELMLAYLDTIDTYQSQCATIASAFSNGFMALAQANFNTPGRRFGQDFYDERMVAMRGVEIREEEEGVVFEGKKIPIEMTEDESRKEEAEKKEDDPRDPLRWFGILVPQALRTTQSEFTTCVEVIPQLLTTLSKLSSLESRVIRARAKHLYKILPEAPPSPLPEALPLSPLDAGDGFIHMCTSTQVSGVVGRFMGDTESVWLLKIPIERVEEGLKWEGSVVNGGIGEEFPHLYGAGIGGAEVLDLKEFKKGENGWGGAFEAANEWIES
ncbi:uncharacterized protein H6S33_002455 [Morchella sextelata]|uniref:uncharacterized protein n=1 Tax=Morchella sextelata TaxID=1174677 RepID=UPI001D05A619|nr:uncharacterized protein H6S33_002455 [Morchella sextelata]KAH0607421.1 hypothetical protein H6S33_002455 [Morchella sextelata]